MVAEIPFPFLDIQDFENSRLLNLQLSCVCFILLTLVVVTTKIIKKGQLSRANN